MKNIGILDCTLRDGGYLVEKKFGDEIINGIISGLSDAKIDIIEIGFLQDEGFGEGKTVYLNAGQAQKYIPKEKNNSLFTAFADCSRYDISNLEARTENSFDAVRECFFKKERWEAIDKCRQIIDKGYLCFVQPVDILGYSDVELLELLEAVNKIEPYCFSLVDTFGSMYVEDLERIFSLVHHNLSAKCKMGFHSHNNLQLSSSLSQAFIRLAEGKREVIVDTTILGMGRGAGNTPTELIVQFLNDKKGYAYNIDSLLDVIDHQMRNIQSRAQWGYNTYFYLAGAYTAHVNNIAFLSRKNSITAKDVRVILSRIDKEKRKRYDYEQLEKIYLDYMKSDIDDTDSIQMLKNVFEKKNVLVLASGKSIYAEYEKVLEYISENNAIVVTINYFHDKFPADFIYFSNVRRYMDYKKMTNKRKDIKLICTSNIESQNDKNIFVVSFLKLINGGWNNADNSTIMLLRLMDILGAGRVGVAGFDGYTESSNYAESDREYSISKEEMILINRELREMYKDFLETKREDMEVSVVTKSLIVN